MVAAVWALLRAIDDGHTRWILLCGALIGFGFLTKQLQVMLVVPGLVLTYLIAGPVRLRIRLLQLLAGLAAMTAAAGWWVLLVELTPAQQRPYIGGSTDNSFLNLTFGYNGFSRLSGGGSGGFPAPPPGVPPLFSGTGGPGPFGHAGLTRMFTGESGTQISWLLPAALILLGTGIMLRRRASRTDSGRAQYLLWGGWLIGTGVVFSFMTGLFHDYYTVALAPAVAALIAIGTVDLWRRRHAFWARLTLASIVALTAAWAWVLLGRSPGFVPPLRWAILIGGGLAAAGLLTGTVLPAVTSPRADMTAWAAPLAAVAALAGPLSYFIQTVTTTHTGGVVTAGPTVAGLAFRHRRLMH